MQHQSCADDAFWAELCSAILDSTIGSIYIGGPCELTQHQEGGKNLRAAKAVVACMFSQRLLSAY